MAATYCKSLSTTTFWCAASSGLRFSSSFMMGGVKSSSPSSDASSSPSSIPLARDAISAQQGSPFSAAAAAESVFASDTTGSPSALISVSLLTPDSRSAPSNSTWRCVNLDTIFAQFCALSRTDKIYLLFFGYGMCLGVEMDAVSDCAVRPLRKDNSVNCENRAAAVATTVKGTPFPAYLFTLGAMQIPPRCKFFSLTETPEDYTIILDEEGFKELPASEFLQVVESAWLVLNVLSNGSASSGVQPIGVTKIAKSVIGPLAQHSVSVLMLSTYQTDFILVREKDLPVVIHTLAGEFEIYQEVNGEPVPAKCDDTTNGFVRPKQVVSANVHPVQSPPNRFCILSVVPETLPAIATILLDVLFYSPGAVKESASSGSSGSPESFAFFAFSLIEGYISIVMDAETKEKFPSDLLLTSSSGELWRMVRIGGQPLGFDECGIVAQIAEPLAEADISAYYISTFNFDHALVPEEGINHVTEVLQKRQESGR